MKKTIILSWLILWIFSTLLYSQSTKDNKHYGIHIKTYPLSHDEFSGMLLDEGKPILLGTDGKLTVTFSLWLRDDNPFGNVMRIITDDGTHIDLVYSVGEEDRRYPMLVVGEQAIPFSKNMRRNCWIEAELVYDAKTGRVRMKYDGETVKSKAKAIAPTQGVRVSFGYCTIEGHVQDEVASVNLRDIKIKEDNQLIRQWKLDRHQGDTCYDDLSQALAVCLNPVWILDEHITFKHHFHHQYESTPSVAFNALNPTLYLAFTNQGLLSYHLHSGKTEELPVNSGFSLCNYPNQLIALPERGELLSYNLNENRYSIYSIAENKWSADSSATKENDYWNCTMNYVPQKEALISFGGYGHYLFRNELIISYPWKPNEVTKVILKGIDPRASTASVVVEDTLFIFGGRGCPTGRPEMGQKNYYDFYAVNLKTYQVKKLWELEQLPEKGEFSPGENMIYDRAQNCFYFICTQQGGCLMRINTREARVEQMSKPICEQIGNPQYLYMNLYKCQADSCFYAVIEQADSKSRTTVDLYSIEYPTCSLGNWSQQTPAASDTGGRRYALIILGVLLTGGIVLVVRLWRRHRSTPPNSGKPTDNQKVTEQNETVQSAGPSTKYYQTDRGYIRFFGGFKVLDKDGNDLSSQFSITLKSLLVLLVLFTEKDGKGIINHKLLQNLWFDRTDESAINNRNVYISKLRSIMQKVGDITISNHKGFWQIKFGEGCFCDYPEAMHLLRDYHEEQADRLLELLLQGNMLPNMEFDWLDPFKSTFSNKAIDCLTHLLQNGGYDDALLLRIADTLFLHDFLNENALTVKCQILCKQNKRGLAKMQYDAFCREYKATLDEEYPRSFKDLVGNN